MNLLSRSEVNSLISILFIVLVLAFVVAPFLLLFITQPASNINITSTTDTFVRESSFWPTAYAFEGVVSVVVLPESWKHNLNKNELKGVLAHEIKHIEANHTFFNLAWLFFLLVASFIITKLLSGTIKEELNKLLALSLTLVTLFILPSPLERYQQKQADQAAIHAVGICTYTKALERIMFLEAISHQKFERRLKNLQARSNGNCKGEPPYTYLDI